jgi:type IV pilus assembly protein PilW
MAQLQRKVIKKTSRHDGFSLIELMVGMVIGLLATLVIMNVFDSFETQKRKTTGNSDAQTNGAIALYNLQRDVQSAGYGLPVFSSEMSPFNCPLNTTIDHDNNAASPQIGLTPVLITDGAGQNGSDIISIRNGDSMKGGIAVNMEAGTSTNVVQADNNIGCTLNDIALTINQPSPGSRALGCSMTRVTGLTAPGVTPVRITLASTTNVAVGNALSCLGVWNELQYTVNMNQLTRSGSLTAAGVPDVTPIPIVTDIVNMQAQYGISDAPDFSLAEPYKNQITQWVNATGIWANTATTPSVENRNRIRAVRIAIVARNGLLENTNITNPCSSTTAAAPTGLCSWEGVPVGGAITVASPAPDINLTADANWQRYRYRVYQSIIPIKNIIWSRRAL